MAIAEHSVFANENQLHNTTLSSKIVQLIEGYIGIVFENCRSDMKVTHDFTKTC